MNQYEWIFIMTDHAQDIATHNRGEGRGVFSDLINRLRTFLETEPFIHVDGESVYADADSVIKSIEINPRLNDKEIVDIILQAIPVGEYGTASQNTPARFVPMKKPTRQDDWSRVIKEASDNYRADHKSDHSREQLWTALKTDPPPEWGIEYDAIKDQLTSPDIHIPLHRTAFYGRYKRYFPQK